MEKLLFTSESVTEGHPDKLCDAVSDAILDACMEQDPMSRVACETASCTGFILVTGEITTKAQLDIPAIVRKTALEIGYDDGKKGLDGNSCAVMVSIDKQSADIAMGVDKALEAKEGDLTDDLDTGAGDHPGFRPFFQTALLPHERQILLILEKDAARAGHSCPIQ